MIPNRQLWSFFKKKLRENLIFDHFHVWEYQDKYKDRVEYDRNFFEIPTLLSCERQNSVGKFKIYVITYFEFPPLDFLVHKIKEGEFQK